MAAPEFAPPIVEEAIQRRSDEGEMAHTSWLQAECGLGREDLEATLEELLDAQKIVEESPGEYRKPYDDELRPPIRPATAPPDTSEQDFGKFLRDVGAGKPGQEGSDGALDPEPGRSVTLTATMARALSPEVLGAFVLAGIGEAADQGKPFWLEVRP